MNVLNCENLNKTEGSIIVKDYEEFARMGRDFCKAAPTMLINELDNALKCLQLAFLSFEWPDTVIGNMHRWSSAPAIMKLATQAYVERQYELEYA